MQKKLTIAIAEDVYEGLHKVIGPRKISKFVEELVRPHVVKPLMEGTQGWRRIRNERPRHWSGPKRLLRT